MATKYRLNPFTNKLERYVDGVTASQVTVNPTNLDGNLQNSGSTVQDVLEFIDELTLGEPHAIHDNVDNEITQITEDASPTDTSVVLGENDSGTKRRFPISGLHKATYNDLQILITSLFTGFCTGALTQKDVNELLDILPRQRYTGLLFDSFGVPIAHVNSGMITGLYTSAVVDDWYGLFVITDGLSAMEL